MIVILSAGSSAHLKMRVLILSETMATKIAVIIPRNACGMLWIAKTNACVGTIAFPLCPWIAAAHQFGLALPGSAELARSQDQFLAIGCIRFQFPIDTKGVSDFGFR